MTMPLPEPRPTIQAGQRQLSPETRKILDEIETVYSKSVPTSVRVEEVPHPAPPAVQQPGRPPMSPRATGVSVMLVAGGFFSLCLGAATSMVLYFSQAANETVVITLCAAPPAVFLSLGALVKKIRKAMPDEHHHHYEAPVFQDQRTTHTETRGVWARTNNTQ
jgi:hypothetical protein